MVDLCSICKKNAVEIHLQTARGENLALCCECNNRFAAEYLGLDLTPFSNGIYEYSGIRGKKHKFHIRKMVHPVGIAYEAAEITGNDNPGFKVNVMDNLDCDQQVLFKRLEAKIKKTLFVRYLKTSRGPYGSKQTHIKNDVVAGRLEYNDDDSGIPGLIIDGKSYSWEELGRMLTPYEGFQFKLKLYDMNDDIE